MQHRQDFALAAAMHAAAIAQHKKNDRERQGYSRYTGGRTGGRTGKGRGIQSTVRGLLVRSSHVTAKTHQTVQCLATPTAAAALPAHVARLQMLQDRANARG